MEADNIMAKNDFFYKAVVSKPIKDMVGGGAVCYLWFVWGRIKLTRLEEYQCEITFVMVTIIHLDLAQLWKRTNVDSLTIR